MMHKTGMQGKRALALLLGLLLVGAVAPAAAEDALSAALVAYRVTVDENGKEQFAKCEQAKPGELLEYRLTYTNQSKQDIKGLKAVLSLPEGMAYQARTAKPEEIHASLDGKTYRPAPLKREVTGADGKRHVVDVPCSECRFLQWQVGTLGAGQEVVLKARVKVVATAAGGQ